MKSDGLRGGGGRGFEVSGSQSIIFRRVKCVFSLTKKEVGYDNIILVTVECCDSQRQKDKRRRNNGGGTFFFSGAVFSIRTSFQFIYLFI